MLDDRVMGFSSATGAATLSGGEVTNLGALPQGPLSAGLDTDPNNTAGAGDTIYGRFVIGTFTRTTSDTLWLLIQGTHPLATNVLLPHLNSFQIRELSSSTAYWFGDGSGATCPCGNLGDAGEGCANPGGAGGATLTGGGNAFLSNDTFSLSVAGVPGAEPGLVLRCANRLSGNLAGDGLPCTAGNTARPPVQIPSAGASVFTDFQSAGFGASSHGVGVATNFPFWHRDSMASPCGGGFNFTNAVAVVWAP